MSLQAGTRLGPYEVTAPIGAGGMGEVYRATDTKLRRDVAIKVLPDDFAGNPERLARFEREAHILASLNHPNIASIYGLEESDGQRCLVLELVEGETLAERIAAGALPVDEALSVAQQIASALEAAHDKGIIHRDLKPANVKIAADGTVKVLDFGLAKALHPDSSVSQGSNLSHSPTVTAGGTREGVILGTAPYMSPEQARGKALDKRTDIWSFGCVLYECLTGQQMFRGETATDILSAILRAEPEWSELPDRTPPRVRELLQRCLEREFKNRLHDIGDARIDLDKSIATREWTTSGIGAAGPVLSMRRRVTWRGALALAASFTLLGAAAATSLWFPQSSGSPVGTTMRFSIQPPPGRKILWETVHPDGQTIGYIGMDKEADGSDWRTRFYTRRLGEYEQRVVEDSDGVFGGGVTGSPDGRWWALGVWGAPGSTDLRTIKVPVDASAPPLRIIDDGSPSALWLPGGEIIALSLKPYTLARLDAENGTWAQSIPIQGVIPDDGLVFASPLPDGHTVLAYGWFYLEGGGEPKLLLLDTRTGQTRLLLDDAAYAAWSPTGHLLFTRRDKLLAVPFDPDRLEITGGPTLVADGLRTKGDWLHARFSFSTSGTLVYRPGGQVEALRRLAVLDGANNIEYWSEERRSYGQSWTNSGPIAVSPDGRRLAVTLQNLDGVLEIWVSDFSQARLRPLAGEAEMDCYSPVWAHDAERLVYTCQGTGGKFRISIRDFDGSGEPTLLTELEEKNISFLPLSMSPDGSALLIGRGSIGQRDILLLPMEPHPGGDREPRTLIEGKRRVAYAKFSPSGRWISYASDETGRWEVYVRGFTSDGELGPKILVSTSGGASSWWAKGSRGAEVELYYRDLDNHLMVLSMTSEPDPMVSEPSQVLDFIESGIVGIDTLSHGKLLAIMQGEEEQSNRINVVLNFHEELKQRVPTQ